MLTILFGIKDRAGRVPLALLGLPPPSNGLRACDRAFSKRRGNEGVAGWGCRWRW